MIIDLITDCRDSSIKRLSIYRLVIGRVEQTDKVHAVEFIMDYSLP